MTLRPLLLLTFLITASSLLSCTTRRRVPVLPPAAERFATPYHYHDSMRPARLMIVGDLQPTHWLERAFLGRKQNDPIRAAMIEEVVARHPDLFLMLGDMVADGACHGDWQKFDTLTASIRDAGIATYAVLGNHDYGMIDVKGIQQCGQRFPHTLRLPGLIRLSDSVVAIILDSNLDALPEHRLQDQQREYRRMLEEFDRDPGIRGVIVATHHPPMTNASLRIDPRVNELFAPPFLAAKKTRLFLSGHIHSYERFEVDGKTFVVTGGGGGPRREVDTAEGRNHSEDIYRHGTLRYHNFLDLSIRDEGIRGEVWMLVDGEFRLGDGFALRW